MYDIFQKLLDERGVTAYKVSKDTGVSTATLSSWKNGKYTPKPDKIQKLADYFGVPSEYLMTGKEPAAVLSPVSEPAPKDERDIAKDLDSIMKKIRSGENSPLRYNGEVIDGDSLQILEDAIGISMRHLKIINNQKYNAYRNKNSR